MPVDWKTSYTRTLHLPSLKLTQNEVSHAGSRFKQVLKVMKNKEL